MRKLVLPAIAGVLSIAVVLVSCSKEEEEAAAAATYAAITGTAWANLDETNDTLPDGTPQTQWEAVPSGTKVVARIDPADFTNNPDVTVNYENMTWAAIIGSSGEFSFDSIKAFGTDVNVELIFDDFAYDTKIWTVDTGSNVVVGTQRMVYETANVNVNAVANGTQVVDVQY